MSDKKFLLILLMPGLLQAVERFQLQDQRQMAYQMRVAASAQGTILQPAYSIAIAETNPDQSKYPDFAGQFSKVLEHDPVTGALTPNGQTSYKQLVFAGHTGKQSDFNAIERTPNAPRVFVNPQGGMAFALEGEDCSVIPMPLPPQLDTAWEAAEMLEVYLQAICRDVTFSDYGTGLRTDSDGVGGSLTLKACKVLNDLGSAYHGPRNDQGKVDPSVLFRGVSANEHFGPYVSQFFILDELPLFPAGCVGFVAALSGIPNLPLPIFTKALGNTQWPIQGKREFGVSWTDYIAIQNGFVPKKFASTDYDANNLRYAINGRDLGSFTHYDGPYQAYYNAMNILASRGFPTSPAFPYNQGLATNDSAGLTMGAPDAYQLVGGATIEAFRNAWAHKWQGSLRLRPEVYAGYVHQAKITGTNPYNLHPSMFAVHDGVDVLKMVLDRNKKQATTAIDPQHLLTTAEASTYLLGQLFPEASPAHPAYPSGHATGAGAAVTVIKAIFNDTVLIKTKVAPVKVNPNDPTKLVALNGEGENYMTVASELDKLASNIAQARDFAGVHWRSDAEEGILLGEQVAIAYLQSHARIYNEQGFTGFELTKRDGTRIRITPDEVIVIG